MAGGDERSYVQASPILSPVAALSADGSPCVSYVGDNGAGHFVKMVHNGIEYAEMQLIAETYNLLRNGLNQTPDQIAARFSKWIEDEHDSYLLRITVDILNHKDGNGWLLDKISDQAECKGTGGWSLNTANDLKVAVPSIAEALFTRFLSSDKQTRTKAQKTYQSRIAFPEIAVDKIGKALFAARIVNHHQGFQLISKASQAYGWDVNLSNLALVWTGGCIIKSSLMEKLVGEFTKSSQLLLSQGIVPVIRDLLPAFKDTVITSLNAGVPVPVLASNLSYLLAFQQGDSPANLIQAQRDYFGAHRFQFANDPSGKMIHFNWKKNMP
jgi:6-phosphogluconate dehydrogenase